ncbi:MAG TPA: class I SAM-dependent methyltransferase [Dongiaceae bacterium]|jgi:predicted O-methyltransferase YrrM
MAGALSQHDFEEIAIRCSGMLAPSIYQRIYEIARDASGDLIVEVGTAKGAATVALALGLRAAGKSGRVISFDRGRERSGRGNPAAYAEAVRRNLRHFGVEDLVELVVGEIKKTAGAVPASAEISVLMLDADGAIDRDLGLFFSRVAPGGPIIIDDCADLVRLERVGLRTTRIDAKMRLTYLLLSYFKENHVLSEGTQIKDTYFGEKLRGFPGDHLDLNDILEIYRQLVFTSAKTSAWATARLLAIRLLKRINPTLTQRLRVHGRRHVSAHPRRPG